MILSEFALQHFDEIWRLFDRSMLEARGSMFLVEPFEPYFTIDFAKGLTPEAAHRALHENLMRWGEIEQSEHKVEQVALFELSKGDNVRLNQFKDPDVRWARSFIVAAFYNIDCLATHKYTIEELILHSLRYLDFAKTSDPEEIAAVAKANEDGRKAFYRLLGVSRAFLLADWSRQIIRKAVSNDDERFFKGVKKSLLDSALKRRFATSRKWLGVTMLWYLGGKEMKRREFMNLLSKKGIMSKDQDEWSFSAELSKLRLIR